MRRVERRLEIPGWDDAAIEHATNRLAPKLASGGALLGAFDGDRLVAATVLGGELVGPRSDQLELAFLYVSASFRRRGIGSLLLAELGHRARERGAAQLYVPSSDTESAIAFYLRNGCRVAEQAEPAIAAENEPTDIPLVLDL